VINNEYNKKIFLKNIDGVVDRLIEEVSFKDKTKIVNMPNFISF